MLTRLAHQALAHRIGIKWILAKKNADIFHQNLNSTAHYSKTAYLQASCGWHESRIGINVLHFIIVLYIILIFFTLKVCHYSKFCKTHNIEWIFIITVSFTVIAICPVTRIAILSINRKKNFFKLKILRLIFSLRNKSFLKTTMDFLLLPQLLSIASLW